VNYEHEVRFENEVRFQETPHVSDILAIYLASSVSTLLTR